MNYRDFFKNKKTTESDIKKLIPEGVTVNEFNKGLLTECKSLGGCKCINEKYSAAKIVGKNLKQDKHYYTKITEHCGQCEEDQFSQGQKDEGIFV